MSFTQHLRIYIIAFATLAAVGCSNPPPLPTPSPTASPSPTPAPTTTPTPTPSPTATSTPAPTATPIPQPQVLFQYSRALQLLEAGFYEDAITDFGLVIRFLPEFAQAYHGRGLAYFNDNHPNLALQDFNRAIELDPKLADAYRDRATLHAQQGDIESAIADLEMALSLYDEVREREKIAEARASLEELMQN